ncbi:MAG: DUF6389 family protein [Halopseudomonas sp.]|uniref:DUF6389 family protein n=1 Tax=Halopseudomonas sp. TaxID=2901191 RepID=UPI003003185C
MNQPEYIQTVDAVLTEHTESAVETLRRVLDLLPEIAQVVTLDVMVDQGAEGFLTVQVGLGGPNLYVLNKSIHAHRILFDTFMTPDGLVPNLPLMEGNEFDVGDTLTDCAARWLVKVWRRANHDARGLPVTVESPERYGTALPIKLQ